jgi:hypothetical protein
MERSVDGMKLQREKYSEDLIAYIFAGIVPSMWKTRKIYMGSKFHSQPLKIGAASLHTIRRHTVEQQISHTRPLFHKIQ